jgi:tryptophanyl-tRNA synthetase
MPRHERCPSASTRPGQHIHPLFILYTIPTMSNPPATPDGRNTSSASGTMTPGGIATQFSKLDLPAPSGLRLNLPSSNLQSNPLSPMSAGTDDTGDISGPEPEAIIRARNHARSESMSEQLSAQLAEMRLPQPERIFGPDEGEDEVAKRGHQHRGSVTQEDWDKIKLDDEVPEAVKEPKRMAHSRNTSRA